MVAKTTSCQPGCTNLAEKENRIYLFLLYQYFYLIPIHLGFKLAVYTHPQPWRCPQ